MLIELLTPLPRRWLSHAHEERVALLLGSTEGDTYTVRKTVPIPNRASDKRHRFVVRKSDVRLLIGNAPVIGVIHSHLDGDPEPSDVDLDCLPEGWIGLVWADGRVGSAYTRKSRLPHARLVYRDLEQAALLHA